MNVPVLIIAWRRPHTLRQVINAIRLASPSLLFVACDGPNPGRPGEAEKVEAVRAVIDQEIDWPCRIERLYSDFNQGCRLGVSSAITWFFQHVDEGIILEDDCVPHPDFLPYCQLLLEQYRTDTRVWCISGGNFQRGNWRGNGDYFFGRIPLIWGWATWRRCWQYYDQDLQLWPDFRDSGLLSTVFTDPLECKYWSDIWQGLAETSLPDTWDYQWVFTCISNGGLTALPNRNLVSNIGFGDDATHTTGSAVNTKICEGVDPTRHPEFVLSNAEADRFTYYNHFGGKLRRFPFNFILLSLRSIRSVFCKLKLSLCL